MKPVLESSKSQSKFLNRLKAAIRVLRQGEKQHRAEDRTRLPSRFQLDDTVMYGRKVCCVVAVSFKLLDTELGSLAKIFYTVRLSNGACVELLSEEIQPFNERHLRIVA